jgi:two-component system chemotaxis sensor kinase CheA
MMTTTQEADVPIVLNLPGDGELLKEYVLESREHLNNIEQGALVLEEHPGDLDTLHSIFRSFHTFKGGAGFLNLVPIGQLAHGLESLLDLARQRKLDLNGERIELILRGRDILKQFIDQIDVQLTGAAPPAPIVIPTADFARQIQDAMTNEPKPAPALEPSRPAAASVASANASVKASDKAAFFGTAGGTPAQPAGETPAPRGAAVPGCEFKPRLAARTSAWNDLVAGPDATVKVDTSKLDSLIDLVGELVIAQSLVAQDLDAQAAAHPRLARNLAHTARVTRELQRASLALRMVPIRGVFQKMTRVVRDLAARQNKEVQLTTEGDETELDRNLVEELADPLLHMIRNAIDHGIETAEARAARGKSRAGLIRLRARHQGGGISVELQDDGQGLDKERILAKAVELGLAEPGATLSDGEIFQFIFAPGFSTAREITDLSGRGVGMDVVRRNIERLRGRVEVESAPGQGTLFKLVLPLTMAIIDGLIVLVGGERYIIPTLLVRESFRPRREMVSTLHGRGEMVNMRGRLIPMLRLGWLFGVKPAAEEPCEGVIVVVQTGATLIGLLVDGLLHRQEVVIKNVGEMIRQRNASIAGAAILGDGRVGLIIDVNALASAPASAKLAYGT